jgi:hypothetical protein
MPQSKSRRRNAVEAGAALADLEHARIAVMNTG